jgi:hypothetical protein
MITILSGLELEVEISAFGLGGEEAPRFPIFSKFRTASPSEAAYSVVSWNGAGRGSRTPKTRRSADFESAASASSAIPA